jgi:hypothetical protein
MKKEIIGTTKNGCDVYVDMENSHASTHFADTPKLLAVVKAILPTVEANEDHMRFDIDTREEVGTTSLIETNESDEIVYALRPNRDRYSRFVRNKTPQKTSWVTIDLKKTDHNAYDLYTAFAGRLTPSFPGGDFLPEQSHDFWSKHALVWGIQDVVPGTETKDCPW